MGAFLKKGCDFMWTVVYLAQTKDAANKLSQALIGEGMLVKIVPAAKGEGEYHKVLVPEAEVEEAHGVIIEIGF